MGDFLLDIRPRGQRTTGRDLEGLGRATGNSVHLYEFEKFSLGLVSVDRDKEWGPFRTTSGSLFVAVCGRVTFDESQWQAPGISGTGGRACRIVASLYSDDGPKALRHLNGNFALFLWDRSAEKLYFANDRCGLMPCFGYAPNASDPVLLSSHPDVLATIADVSKKWDAVSLSQFICTGRLTHPYTYYQSIRGFDYGVVAYVDFNGPSPEWKREWRFRWKFSLDKEASREDLAQLLAGAFRTSVSRRSHRAVGPVGVSLSGGLDSRAVLSCIPDRSYTRAFCFFDNRNVEFSLAAEIAKASGVDLVPLQRAREHYGMNAKNGVRLSGGMGDFGSNHYLGFASELRKLGFGTLLTGFYCDYFFKGLLLDKLENKFLRLNSPGPFGLETYMPHFWFGSKHEEAIRDRLEALYPIKMRGLETDEARLDLERRRLFPLCYEPDNQETLIPQRVLPFHLPVVDNAIVDVYLRLPPRFKLNVSVYARMVEIVCGPKVSAITNINTGTRVNAPYFHVLIQRNLTAIRRFAGRARKTIVSDESWPNWHHYISSSPKIAEMWFQPSEAAIATLGPIVGEGRLTESPDDYVRSGRIKLFLRLLTAKLWIELQCAKTTDGLDN